MTSMTPENARLFWKELMGNAASLIADAEILLRANSAGRAKSLSVLAQEELGKAVWVYDCFHSAWSEGSAEAKTVDRLDSDGRKHTAKYLEAFVYGLELDEFWGDYSRYSKPRPGESYEQMTYREIAENEAQAAAAARIANTEKQRGFYVDLGGDGSIHSPREMSATGLSEVLQRAARVIEMSYIVDHTRMKHASRTPYDSTLEQQFGLVSISHPDLFEAAVESVAMAALNNGPTGESP